MNTDLKSENDNFYRREQRERSRKTLSADGADLGRFYLANRSSRQPVFAELPAGIGRGNSYSMSTVLEIENAVQKLPAEKLAEFAAWFEDYQTMVSSSAEVFALYDREEEK